MPLLWQSAAAVATAALQLRRAALCNKELKGEDRQAEYWDARAIAGRTQTEERAQCGLKHVCTYTEGSL